MTKEDFEQLKSTVKQWLFHTGSLDPTNYANELKLKFIKPREKRIEELEMTVGTLRIFSNEQATSIERLEKENAELKEHIKADCIDCADYIKNQKLEKENHLLGERCNQLLKDKGDLTDRLEELQEQNSEMFNTIALQEQQIEKMKRCEICKHYQGGSCNYHSNWVKDCKENGMKLFELKEIKENGV